MLFNSYIFILGFLPIVVLGYYFFVKCKKQKITNYFLMLMSFVFYLYAGIECFVLLLIDIIINYIFYKKIYDCRQNRKKKNLLVFGVITNVLFLLYFKYYNFGVDSINLVFNTSLRVKDIVQPLGISFIVFQQIAFLVDTYRGENDRCSIGEFMSFITFFPHISSGPIIVYKDLIPKIRADKQVDWDNIATGIYFFVMGLGKKVLIADVLAQSVNWGYANIDKLNTTSALFVTVAYTMQIYFDFSGYSDMAIGISRILQLDLPVNFNSPYKSKTILEFWDRWHITLTRFFTRYLYIPLGGSRKGNFRTYLNTLIVFGVSGIWHGASYTFIIWGILHGLFMIFTKKYLNIITKIPNWVNQCITLIFVNFTWIFFRAGSLSVSLDMIKRLLTFQWGNLCQEVCQPFEFRLYSNLISEYVPLDIWTFAILVLILCFVLLGKNVQEYADKLKYSVGSCIIMVLISIYSVCSFGGISSFIYSNF